MPFLQESCTPFWYVPELIFKVILVLPVFIYFQYIWEKTIIYIGITSMDLAPSCNFCCVVLFILYFYFNLAKHTIFYFLLDKIKKFSHYYGTNSGTFSLQDILIINMSMMFKGLLFFHCYTTRLHFKLYI